jgi:hypothetical protein
MRRAVERSVIVAWILLLACSGCGPQRDVEGEVAPARPTVSVTVRALETRGFADVIIAPGQWRAGSDLPVVAPFAATVEALAPRVGDRVRKQETVGWLVTRESQAALRGADLLAREARDPASRDEAARAQALARRDMIRVPLVAPQSGVVVRRSAVVGSQVVEASEILAIVVPGGIVFEAHVAARDAARLRPGQSATIGEEGRPPRRARLQRTLPMASAGDQATLAWLVCEPGSAPPDLDRFGTSTIVVGEPRQAVAVPDSALVEDDLTGDTRIATVSAAGRVRWVKVMLGAGTGGWHELRSPALGSGTRVIVEGQHGLADSTSVRPGP